MKIKTELKCPTQIRWKIITSSTLTCFCSNLRSRSTSESSVKFQGRSIELRNARTQ